MGSALDLVKRNAIAMQGDLQDRCDVCIYVLMWRNVLCHERYPSMCPYFSDPAKPPACRATSAAEGIPRIQKAIDAIGNLSLPALGQRGVCVSVCVCVFMHVCVCSIMGRGE